MSSTTSKATINNQLTDTFDTMVVPIAIPVPVRELPSQKLGFNLNINGTKPHKSNQLVTYSDDSCILPRLGFAKDLLLREHETGQIGLQITESNTKIIKQIRSGNHSYEEVKLNGVSLETVEEFYISAPN